MKKAEISHAALRIEYLKSSIPKHNTNTTGSTTTSYGSNLVLSKEYLIKTFTDSIASNICPEDFLGGSNIQSKLEEMKNDFVRMIESSDNVNGETQHNDDGEIGNCDDDNTNGFDSDNNEEATSTVPSESKKSKANGERVMTNPQAKGNVKHEILLDYDEKNDAQTHTDLHKVHGLVDAAGGDMKQNSFANKQQVRTTKDGYTGTYMKHVLQKKIGRGYVPTHVEIDALVDLVNVIDFFKAKKKDGLLQGTARGYKSSISSFYLSHFPEKGKKWDDATNTGNPAFHPTVVDIVNSLPIKKEKG